MLSIDKHIIGLFFLILVIIQHKPSLAIEKSTANLHSKVVIDASIFKIKEGHWKKHKPRRAIVLTKGILNDNFTDFKPVNRKVRRDFKTTNGKIDLNNVETNTTETVNRIKISDSDYSQFSNALESKLAGCGIQPLDINLAMRGAFSDTQYQVNDYSRLLSNLIDKYNSLVIEAIPILDSMKGIVSVRIAIKDSSTASRKKRNIVIPNELKSKTSYLAGKTGFEKRIVSQLIIPGNKWVGRKVASVVCNMLHVN